MADQDLALQLDALAKAGCARGFEDRASGAKTDRPGLTATLAFVWKGDVLVVWKLDRLGRSQPHLIETVTAPEGSGVGFRSLTEAIEPRHPVGSSSSTSSVPLDNSSAISSESEPAPVSMPQKLAVVGAAGGR